jgi:hypothetical protein
LTFLSINTLKTQVKADAIELNKLDLAAGLYYNNANFVVNLDLTCGLVIGIIMKKVGSNKKEYLAKRPRYQYKSLPKFI